MGVIKIVGVRVKGRGLSVEHGVFTLVYQYLPDLNLSANNILSPLVWMLIFTT